MSVTERQRHALHEWVRRVGDEEVAATLMELLPPVGWADVATTRDLDQLERQLRSELSIGLAGLRESMIGGQVEIAGGLSGLRTEMADLRTEVQREMRLQLYWLVGSLWAVLGVALAVLGR